MTWQYKPIRAFCRCEWREKSPQIATCFPYRRLYELLASSSLGDLDHINIHTLQITDVEFGTVKQSDVEIVFPEGTEVVDAINGTFYKTDARGNPIESTMEYLYDFDPSHAAVPLPEPESRTVNYVLMVIGIVLILIALYMMLHQRRRNAS